MQLTSMARACLILCPMLFTARVSPSQTISATPHRAAMDEPVSLLVKGLPATHRASIRASMIDHSGRLWESREDVARTQSGKTRTSEGLTSRVDATHLLTSMRVRADSSGLARFESDWRDTLKTVFVLEVGDSVVAADTIVRSFLPPGIVPTR